MLRKIGGGSYGQVWMARSVTGAYRAIKIVAREDFRLERTFEREFEGIKRFEPVSRSHPGVVHILHVGRSVEENFYYYVMEVADDQDSPPSAAIDPDHYHARTLRGDIQCGRGVDVDYCIQIGILLADALHHLHKHGLSHRDVKPSNIIFVNGVAKLADIGLVAETGQQTFVGTEGFVPPEGPGTAQADLYSLGMVLYELSTGNDRLDFPELPDHLNFSEEEHLRWRQLNEVICKACAPDRKHRYKTSEELRLALEEVARGHPPLAPLAPQIFAYIGLLALVILVWMVWKADNSTPAENDPQISEALQGTPPNEVFVEAPPPTEAAEIEDSQLYSAELPSFDMSTPDMLYITPKGAWLYTREGRELAPTPTPLNFLRQLNEPVYIEAPGSTPHVLEPDQFDTPEIALARYPPSNLHSSAIHDSDPYSKVGWTNSLGMVFRYDSDLKSHITLWPVSQLPFEKWLTDSDRVGKVPYDTVPADHLYPGYTGNHPNLVLTTPADAHAFCVWLTQQDQRSSYLPIYNGETAYEAVLDPVFTGPHRNSERQLFRCHLIPPQ